MDGADIPMHRVHHVIVTHSHPDHFGGAGMLAQESGAEVVASSYFRTWYDPSEEAGEPQLDWRQNDEDDEAFIARFEHPTPWGGDSGKLKDVERASFLARRREVRTWFAPPRPIDARRRRRPPGARVAASGWACTRRATPTTTSACSTPSAARCCRATTCCRPSRPHISGLIEGDPLRAYLDSLDKVGAVPGRHDRAAGPRPSLHRPARTGRGHQGAPRRAARAAARWRPTSSGGPTSPS